MNNCVARLAVPRWQESTLLLAVLSLIAFSLTGCGGSKGDSAGSELSNTPVTATGSPLPNSIGVKSTMGNSTVFALTTADGSGSSALRISISAAHPSIQPLVVAGSVFKVEGATRASDKVYVESPDNITVVYSCSQDDLKCVRVPFTRTGAGIRFAVESNDFFALKK